jgi:hypothetical protein
MNFEFRDVERSWLALILSPVKPMSRRDEQFAFSLGCSSHLYLEDWSPPESMETTGLVS